MDADDERGGKVLKTRGKLLELEKVELIGRMKNTLTLKLGRVYLPTARDVLQYRFYYKQKHFSQTASWSEVIS